MSPASNNPDQRERCAGKVKRCLAVIPCLNEANHIEKLVSQLAPSAKRLDMPLVIVDGGSTDGCRDILAGLERTNSRVVVLDNPHKLQSAAVNLAVACMGRDFDFLIRVDVHGNYPDDYCDRLLAEAETRKADSVVVSMKTVGFTPVQKAAALAQNSKLGNGGSKHREGADGHWTDHGHHALMRIDAFEAVGGYDENFSHNEDAELDHRLKAAGYRIWMTDKTAMVYHPRSSVSGLFRQYMGYGRGRARNILKHGTRPKVRQMLPVFVLPAALFSFLAVFHWTAVLPLAVWGLACLGYGLISAVRGRDPNWLLAGPLAMVMHFAWSVGFWRELFARRDEKHRPVYAAKQRRTRLAGPARVDIGVCTFRRPRQLSATLRSLAALNVGERDVIKVIVADNDETPSARETVTRLASTFPFELEYVHAPARNISAARNACLETGRGDYLAFIDDDEVASPDWLMHLLDAAAKEEADAVLGPVRAEYDLRAPDWMRKGDVHSTYPVRVHGAIRTGYTCNALLRRTTPTAAGLRFNVARGRSGGEDTEYFTRLFDTGGRIAYAPDAWVREAVPEERARFSWLARRRFRMGQTHGQLLRARSQVSRIPVGIGLAFLKVGYCFGMAVLLAPSTLRRNRFALRGILHAGVVSGLAGGAEIVQYGHIEIGQDGYDAA